MAARPTIHEIVLEETQPATEWILDRPVQKVSPQWNHAALQLAFGERLRSWARGRGRVGTEWRFRITPPGEITRPLVPDVAYLSTERSRDLTTAERQVPPVAPDIVVEILSPDDRSADVDHKRASYLAAGTRLVILVDDRTRTVSAYGGDGSTTTFGDGSTFAPEGFPGLEFPLSEIFSELDVP